MKLFRFGAVAFTVLLVSAPFCVLADKFEGKPDPDACPCATNWENLVTEAQCRSGVDWSFYNMEGTNPGAELMSLDWLVGDQCYSIQAQIGTFVIDSCRTFKGELVEYPESGMFKIYCSLDEFIPPENWLTPDEIEACYDWIKAARLEIYSLESCE